MAHSSLSASRDHAHVIAPPPLIFAAFLAAGAVAGSYVGWGIGLSSALRQVAGFGLLVAGTVFLALALGLFRRAQTCPEPWQPTTAIVSTGIYGITRNPMYVGMALAYAGVALLAHSLMALLLLPFALAVIHFGVIRREERYLEAKFGDEYRGYAARVRRWWL
ncbi:MAG TPA: isoprenylcysteine carboxylmethyltransferase family protein [Mesorhizobium sp.]|nr:isoprenylcysteine carboxylmethyltransferase family protein [Mesorhizobium sp.]